MRGSWIRGALALALVSAMGSACTPGEKQQTSSEAMGSLCNRTCLIKTANEYLAALVAHDPRKVSLASNIGFVENLHRMKPGEGLWKTITGGPTNFKIYVPDVDVQEVAWMGVLHQDGKPIILALRLKLKDGKITEAEHLIAPVETKALPNLQTPRSGLVAEIPAAQRLPHDTLMLIAATYYDALDDNDGSMAPFAGDCQRRENGITSAGAGAVLVPSDADPKGPSVSSDCKAQMDSNFFEYIRYINHRRVFAADPVTGLAIGFSQFRHAMDNLPYKVKYNDGLLHEITTKNMPFKPFDLPAAHIFKIGPDKKLHQIEAIGYLAPYKSPTGWE